MGNSCDVVVLYFLNGLYHYIFQGYSKIQACNQQKSRLSVCSVPSSAVRSTSRLAIK